MKFFHVYNEKYFDGLVKNNLINEDTGFKIQHIFSMPDELKFNKFAAKGTKLHSIIKDGKIPFYVDRLSGGCTYHEYAFDHDLIREYENILGKWFLGFQLHESASNIRQGWIYSALPRLKNKGPFTEEYLRENFMSPYAKLPDGTPLPALGHYRLSEFAKCRFAETSDELIEEITTFYKSRMDEMLGKLLPVDSYFLMTKLQDELGMNTFAPEVGWQISQMRIAVSLVRGIADAKGKLWGTYYETWLTKRGPGNSSIPCYNSEPGNEWYLPQDQHPDDFSTYGENGGSSRRLQKRIYYYSLMAGADYLGEEWGLNCSYRDMHDTFELSPYGIAKKEFIDFAREHKNVKAEIPFAIVLPLEYQCVDIDGPNDTPALGLDRTEYMECAITDTEKAYLKAVETPIKFILSRTGETYGNESHVIENSRFGDLFDIIYEDASDEVLSKYAALVDVSPEGSFIKAKGDKFRVFGVTDLEKLKLDLDEITKEVLPVFVDDLHWLVSKDNEGRRYLSIFNNEGNMRTKEVGDTIDHAADRRVKVSFKDAANLKLIKSDNGDVKIEKVDDKTYFVEVAATAFAIFEF